MGALIAPPYVPPTYPAGWRGRPWMPCPDGIAPGDWRRALDELFADCPPAYGLWDGPPAEDLHPALVFPTPLPSLGKPETH